MKKPLFFDCLGAYHAWHKTESSKSSSDNFEKNRVVVVADYDEGYKEGKDVCGYTCSIDVTGVKKAQTAFNKLISELHKLNISEIETILNVMPTMHVTSFHNTTVEIKNTDVFGYISERENGFYIEIDFTFKSETVETSAEAETSETEKRAETEETAEPETATSKPETEATTEKVWTVTQLPHVVRTFDKNGKMVYEDFFETAEKAYEEYVDIIENLKRNLPYGEETTVVRFAEGKLMCSETIKGTCFYYNLMQKIKATEEQTAEEPKAEDTATVMETQTTEEKAKKQRKNINWINESNVQISRGNYEPCIFKFDNSKVWFNSNAICTTHSIKSMARRMAQHYNAKEITIKYLWIDDKHTSEPRENVVDFIDDYYGENYKFRIELPVKEGEKRQFRYFEESEIFCE